MYYFSLRFRDDGVIVLATTPDALASPPAGDSSAHFLALNTPPLT
jgi:hypothetical protein